MTLFVGACAVHGDVPAAEVEDNSAELVAVCTDDSQCPVSRIACRLCADGTKSCPEAECVHGRCVQHFPSCPYQPCANQACGTECRQCPPNDPRCIETAVVKYCQADGSCSPQPPLCEAPKVFCGGIAGIPCPGNSVCIDDPDDNCAPPEGADCSGICVCPKRSICPKGSTWSADPEVCACVPDTTCN
jgi:hypothetical protein